MIGLIFTLCAIGFIVYLLLKLLTPDDGVFKNQGLVCLRPLPGLGNSDYFFRQGGLVQRILSIYKTYPDKEIIGFYEFFTPMYFIRNPEIVKQLAVKDFHHFQDHRPFIDSSIDEFFGSMLFNMKGKQWREMRSALSPMFTGSKMRIMMELILNCSNQMVKYIEDNHKEKGLQPYGIKNLFSRYTTDVIATCAFGVACDSLKYPNNDIYMIGQELLNFQKPSLILKLLLVRFLPKLCKFLGIRPMNEKVRNKFEQMILTTMEERKKQNIVRPDMLQLLMKLKEGQQLSNAHDDENDGNREEETFRGEVKHSWTDVELVAQCFLFFLGGFDTSSTVMIFIAYELALNPDIQSKLIEVIDEVHEKLGGKPITYEELLKIKYLDMVISEVLRKWPPAPAVDRYCVKDYTYEGEDGLKFKVKEGSALLIPIYGYHMDPKYFPDPEKFDPERFSDENQANIDMNVYLPFGIGPRNCIGLRFALMEIKVLFYNILLNFNIKVCKETQIPLTFRRSPFGFIPDKDVQLCFEPRNK